MAPIARTLYCGGQSRATAGADADPGPAAADRFRRVGLPRPDLITKAAFRVAEGKALIWMHITAMAVIRPAHRSLARPTGPSSLSRIGAQQVRRLLACGWWSSATYSPVAASYSSLSEFCLQRRYRPTPRALLGPCLHLRSLTRDASNRLALRSAPRCISAQSASRVISHPPAAATSACARNPHVLGAYLASKVC